MQNVSELPDGFASRALPLIPIILAAILFLVGLTRTDLWTPDEPRYALVAREMLDRGSIIQPFCNGKPYTEKPPLFFWLIMIGAKIFGDVNQLAVRLPSVLSALGTITLMIGFVKQYVGRKAAGWSAVVLALSPLFFWLARSGHIDMLLTFLVTAGLVSFYRWHRGEEVKRKKEKGETEEAEEEGKRKEKKGKRQEAEGARQEGGRWGYLVIFYACLALGTLAKGPVGMVLPLLVVVVFALLKRNARELLRMRLHIGLPLAIAAVLAWYIPASVQSAGYSAGNVVGRQIIERVLAAGPHSVSPWMWPFAAALSLLWGMAPWSVLLPFAAVAIWRERRSSDARFFMLAWAMAILGFFTVISSKRELYLLPMFPACAAMAGSWLADECERRIGMLRRMAMIAGVVTAVGAAVAMVAGPGVLHNRYPEVEWPPLLNVLAAGALCSGAAVAVFAAKARSGQRIAMAGSAMLTCAFAAIALFVLPWVNQSKSPRPICDIYRSLRTDDSRLGMFREGMLDEEFVFYSRTQIELMRSAAQLDAFMDSPGPRFCFARKNEFERIRGALKSPFSVLAERRVSSYVVLLLWNQNQRPDAMAAKEER